MVTKVGVRGVCSTTKTYNGKNCPVCDQTMRYESTGGCVACAQRIARESYQKYPEKAKERSKQDWVNNKPKRMDTVYLRNYGISLIEYDELYTNQNGLCKICLQLCSTGRRLCVDHNHKTGKVRGLLCLNCNRAIGNFRDSVELLENAKKYLVENDN